MQIIFIYFSLDPIANFLTLKYQIFVKKKYRKIMFKHYIFEAVAS